MYFKSNAFKHENLNFYFEFYFALIINQLSNLSTIMWILVSTLQISLNINLRGFYLQRKMINQLLKENQRDPDRDF